jgi:hypothetical protein
MVLILFFFLSECSVPFTFWAKYKLKMTFPLILLGLVILNSTVFITISKFVQKKQVDFLFVRQRCASFFLQSVVSCYTLIIAGAASPLVCLEQSDGSRTMVRNPSISCYSGEWNANYPIIVLFLVLYAAVFPLILLILLFVNRKNLQEPHMIEYFGSFTRQYKPNFFWWEFVFLTKRALFVAVSGMIPAHPGDSSPYFGCIFLLFGYMAIEFFINPFRRALTAKRSAMWYFVAVLVLMSDGLVFKSDGPSLLIKYVWSIIMLLLIILACATGIMSLIQMAKLRKRKLNASTMELNLTPTVLEFKDQVSVEKLISPEGLEELAKVDVNDIQQVTLTTMSSAVAQRTVQAPVTPAVNALF